MTDRRTAAIVLVLLGGVLAGVSSFLDMYVMAQKVHTNTWTMITSLWGTQSDIADDVQRGTLVSDAWPVLVAAVLMVVAAVFTLRGGRIAAIARVGLMGSAGAFAGVVLAFVVGAIHEGQLVDAYNIPQTSEITMTYLPGLYLLGAAGILALVGAVLAQGTHPVMQAEPDEQAVVVHQFMDDDTPPFGIAMPYEEEAR